ncbi:MULTISPECIES: hypothetical protein [Sellimonas]|uniref:Uncharacterized protein n=1 Tax=Sellimonas caecigallum TaxID=2592333 RepID=A0ABS7L7M2_9FIRM|nr:MULTISPECIES: hypothetical protein [Sellimonas]MBY0759043.1 hypothetical protein [Sellimonas caecigallum]OUP00602.1 hypothetical protein B5F37_10620 [Drancourtella sp. An210]OUP65838.1 hypothetical protein B5F13_05145 [Drancourtella sp. An177]
MELERAKKKRQALDAMKLRENRTQLDSWRTPAVHPRYRASYSSIYPNEEEETTGTFGVRVFVCIALFACFVAADQKSIDIPGYSTKGLLNAIERKMDVNGLPSSFLKEFDLSSIL